MIPILSQLDGKEISLHPWSSTGAKKMSDIGIILNTKRLAMTNENFSKLQYLLITFK